MTRAVAMRAGGIFLVFAVVMAAFGAGSASPMLLAALASAVLLMLVSAAFSLAVPVPALRPIPIRVPSRPRIRG